MSDDRYAPRWYNRAGELIGIEEAEALLCDIDARRVALTNFGEHAQVSTVLLVLDHGWGSGPPIIFETMTFVADSAHDLDCERTSTEAAALAAHDRACAVVRDMLQRFDAELDTMTTESEQRHEQQ